MSALGFEDVSKAFGGVKALRGVSLSVAPGDAHALMGENGAGKSTLMKILYGYYQPSAGRIMFAENAGVQDGEDVRLKSPQDARRRVTA